MSKVITRMDPYQHNEDRIKSIEANLERYVAGEGGEKKLFYACLHLLEIVRTLNAKVAMLERHVGNL
jgi:hypothetical protein